MTIFLTSMMLCIIPVQTLSTLAWLSDFHKMSYLLSRKSVLVMQRLICVMLLLIGSKGTTIQKGLVILHGECWQMLSLIQLGALIVSLL